MWAFKIWIDVASSFWDVELVTKIPSVKTFIFSGRLCNSGNLDFKEHFETIPVYSVWCIFTNRQILGQDYTFKNMMSQLGFEIFFTSHWKLVYNFLLWFLHLRSKALFYFTRLPIAFTEEYRFIQIHFIAWNIIELRTKHENVHFAVNYMLLVFQTTEFKIAALRKLAPIYTVKLANPQTHIFDIEIPSSDCRSRPPSYTMKSHPDPLSEVLNEGNLSERPLTWNLHLHFWK